MDLRPIVARRRLGLLTARDLVEWAVAKLVEGYDAPGLRLLAGLDLGDSPRIDDAEALFLRACGELGLELPGVDAAIVDHVRRLATEIVEGRADPREQVGRIHAEVLTPLDHPPSLMAWCYVGDGLVPRAWSLDAAAMGGFAEIPPDELDDTIRDLASWYLERTREA